MDNTSVPKKVVVVEDNPDLAGIYQTRMMLVGYNCLVANDGIAALYVIQTELPDLVLLDLMVPAIAGDEVLRLMRASDWGKQIPVIIISNLNESDAPTGLRELGITDYVVKANLVGDDLENIVGNVLPVEKQEA
jgi:two-component system phosphate regulon response regulator PhoB